PAAKKQRLDRVLPAGAHLLRVASATGAAATFTLKVTAPDPLPNDSCGDAPALSIPGTASGDTTWATNEVAFPLATSCTGYYVDGGELFYALDLAERQTVTIDLTPGPGFDPALYVLSACGEEPVCVGGVDRVGAGVPERLVFTAPAAGTYYIGVDGAAGGGTFTLSVE
ncbi:MAG TPA: PPC domain-containing protein, partial [Vulgatibacter sp.]